MITWLTETSVFEKKDVEFSDSLTHVIALCLLIFGCWQAPAYLQTNWWWRTNLYTGPAPQGLMQHFLYYSFVIYSIVYLRVILALCTDSIQGLFDSHFGFDACTWLTIKMIHMITSSNGNIFRITGPLCREFIGHRWIPLTKASDAELWCFLWSVPWISGWVWGWWFEKPSHSLRPHCNSMGIYMREWMQLKNHFLRH